MASPVRYASAQKPPYAALSRHDYFVIKSSGAGISVK
jgi:hypothetical protein